LQEMVTLSISLEFANEMPACQNLPVFDRTHTRTWAGVHTLTQGQSRIHIVYLITPQMYWPTPAIIPGLCKSVRSLLDFAPFSHPVCLVFPQVTQHNNDVSLRKHMLHLRTLFKHALNTSNLFASGHGKSQISCSSAMS
jgi:hypothetical protein